ncbi:MAG: 1-acyl-sn-glycerol-3-phosphate acyltransferase [Pseudobdellovibrionaceae bacterium]|nr:1-acyl-sn-glycerol-3-phosphate acyltransferase [Bdellovibrionales bacterium]USN48301.1 MAG: 1-acyl-sn-glycerol-3-phosphate acyltransferase [Pseudobdellovibrionaceae bacterium]
MATGAQPPWLIRWISYLRSFTASIATLTIIAVYGLCMIVAVLVTRSQKVGDFFVRTWSQSMMWMFNIKVVVRGLENLPDEGCLYIFNHSSHFDIPIFHSVMPQTVRFGAKIELFKFPIFGHAMRVAGVLPIVRHDKKAVFKVYEEAISRVKKGEKFILAAEGTRHTKPEVGPRFKVGPFLFAINGQFPIVPVVIVGAHGVLEKGRLFAMWGQWRRTVSVEFLSPVSTKGLKAENLTELQNQVQKEMIEAFQKGEKLIKAGEV